MPRTTFNRRFFLTLLAVCIALTSCGLPGRSTPDIPATPAPTSKPADTATAQVPLVVLIIPVDMPQGESKQYQTAIYTLAQANNMRFQVLNSMSVQDLQMEGPALKIVITFPPDPGLAGLLAAAPQVQFLAIGIANLTSAPNLTTIGSTGQPTDQQAFLAGYIAAMLSEDYRIGIITLKDDPQGMAAETAYINGMHFYCGLCLPAFPPVYTYPIHVEIPQDVPKSNYASYGGPLHDYNATIAYVYPAIATLDMYNALVQAGMDLIGESMPSQSLKTNWIASIQPEMLPTIQRVFADLVAGHGGQNLASPLALTDVNPALLSAGKQRLVQEVLDGLQAGTIDTGVSH